MNLVTRWEEGLGRLLLRSISPSLSLSLSSRPSLTLTLVLEFLFQAQRCSLSLSVIPFFHPAFSFGEPYIWMISTAGMLEKSGGEGQKRKREGKKSFKQR